jgi:hypothetical protein
LIAFPCNCKLPPLLQNRLISTSTVEENILKKAQQKRALGNMAIEDGKFTTEFFRQQHSALGSEKQSAIRVSF